MLRHFAIAYIAIVTFVVTTFGVSAPAHAAIGCTTGVNCPLPAPHTDVIVICVVVGLVALGITIMVWLAISNYRQTKRDLGL